MGWQVGWACVLGGMWEGHWGSVEIGRSLRRSWQVSGVSGGSLDGLEVDVYQVFVDVTVGSLRQSVID